MDVRIPRKECPVLPAYPIAMPRREHQRIKSASNVHDTCRQSDLYILSSLTLVSASICAPVSSKYSHVPEWPLAAARKRGATPNCAREGKGKGTSGSSCHHEAYGVET